MFSPYVGLNVSTLPCSVAVIGPSFVRIVQVTSASVFVPTDGVTTAERVTSLYTGPAPFWITWFCVVANGSVPVPPVNSISTPFISRYCITSTTLKVLVTVSSPCVRVMLIVVSSAQPSVGVNEYVSVVLTSVSPFFHEKVTGTSGLIADEL